MTATSRRRPYRGWVVVVSVLAAMNALVPVPTSADTSPPPSPRFTMIDLPGATEQPGCRPSLHNAAGTTLLRCSPVHLMVRTIDGKARALPHTSATVSLTDIARPLMNERDMVAARARCVSLTDPPSDAYDCLARWDSAGQLTSVPEARDAVLSAAVSMNRHGDVVTNEMAVGDADPVMRSFVWWANGKSEHFMPSAPGNGILVAGVTDGRDVYGTEFISDANPVARGARSISSCLTSGWAQDPRNTDPSLNVAKVRSCFAMIGSVPMRWRHARPAQKLPTLPGHTSAAITSVSPSGNHLGGLAEGGAPLKPVRWSGVNQTPMVVNELASDSEPRTVAWLNNKGDYIGREVELLWTPFNEHNYVNINGVFTDLTTDVAGVTTGQRVVAESILPQGNVVARVMKADDSVARRVLLVSNRP